MNIVFPKVTKCTFHKYGPSGTITRHDGLCILALLYRMFIIITPSMRVNAIMARNLYQVERSIVEDVLNCPRHSWTDKVDDYFIIYLLAKNLSPVAMKELLEKLRPVMQPTKMNTNNYPQLGNFEKDSKM